MAYTIVRKITCNNCGYHSLASDFFDLHNSESEAILKKFNWDISRPADKKEIEASYAGAICYCGNFSDFDFILGNDTLEGLASDTEQIHNP